MPNKSKTKLSVQITATDLQHMNEKEFKKLILVAQRRFEKKAWQQFTYVKKFGN